MSTEETPPTPRPKRAATPRSTVTSDSSDTATPKPSAAKPAARPKPEPAARAVATRAPVKPKLQRQLEELLMLPTLATSAMGDAYPTHIITTRAPAVAEAWYDLAQENPAVKRVLSRLVEGSALGGVALATAALVIPVAGYYGLIPAMDPFAAMYARYDEDGAPSSPIVPPPPDENRPASRPTSAGGGTPVPMAPRGQETGGRMTPPVADGAPAGVVTVAALRARGADQSN